MDNGKIKITVLVDNFVPDLGAAAFRFESIVKELANRGHKIRIIASFPNRIDVDKFQEYSYKNVEVIRINKQKLKTGIIDRAKTYFNFFYEALKVGITKSKDSDIIIASSPQLLVGVAGAIIAQKTKKPLILDIRDLWPDIVLDMKVMSRYNPIYLSLKLLEKYMYKQSDFLVYNSPGFFKYLSKKYSTDKMELITNGIDDFILDYFNNKENNVFKKSKYNILYAGNLGIAQDIKILVELAKKRENFEIILIGKGSQENVIKDRIKELELKNIKLISSIPRKNLMELYEKADILFLQLKDIEMFKKTIPSKIFEYLATEKPIVFGLNGVARDILENEFNCKYYFTPNNLSELEKTFDELIFDIENTKYKKPDILKLKNNYSRMKLAEKFSNIVEMVCEKC